MPDANRQAIAIAIYDQYKPESMEDSVPRTVEGAVVAIADKADSIAGMFALGLQPTGSKDPFALRRQANGIIKIIAEHKLPLSLGRLFKDAREAYRSSAAEKKLSAADYTNVIRAFFHERLEFYLRTTFKYDVVNAVLAAGSNDVVDVIARAKAVTDARDSEDFLSVCIAFKRVKNILRQAEEKQIDIPILQNRSLLTPPEMELDEQVRFSSVAFNQLAEKGQYREALIALAELGPSLEKFFADVMVMVDDPKLRDNRLNLLSFADKVFRRIADFSEIVTEGSKESPKQ